MANIKEMVDFACKLKPDQVTLVPEKRQELTTEGGLDVIKHEKSIKKTVKKLHAKGVSVSLFIAADKKQIEASQRTGADCIELHTGEYANAKGKENFNKEFQKLKQSSIYAHQEGLKVYAGHGLDRKNVARLKKFLISKN